LVSDVADNRQIVQESKAGRTVRPKDIEDLEEKLEKILEEDMEQKASNARKYAEEKLDWGKISSKYLRVYKDQV
ncbi:MAG: glycosyltransferase, partial [Candidatus Nanohalobium sp.]